MLLLSLGVPSAPKTRLICFGQVGALHFVLRQNVIAKHQDSSLEYTVRMLNGFNKIKGLVLHTEIKLFVLSFAHQLLAISPIFVVLMAGQLT